MPGWRQAHEAPCGEIRQQVAWGRGGVLRRRTLRRHLDGVPGLRRLRAATSRRHRVGLAVVLPALPSAALRDRVLEAVEEVAAELGLAAAGGAGAAGGSAAGVAGGGAAVGAGGAAGWLGGGMSAGTAGKIAAVALVAGGGLTAAAVEHGGPGRSAKDDARPTPSVTTRAQDPARPSRGRSASRGSTAPEPKTPRAANPSAGASQSASGGQSPTAPGPAAQAPAATPPQQGAGQPRQESGAGGLRIDLGLPEVRVPAVPDPQVRAPEAPPVTTPEVPPRVPAVPPAAP